MLPLWREEAISKTHDRKGFDCGQSDLNAFLARYARQAHAAGSAKTYCAVDAQDRKAILGFYTISPCHIDLHAVPLKARPSGSGRHPLGAFRLARLAVARAHQGQTLGGQILASAVGRCMRVAQEVGGTALLIDAKDAHAAAWYQLYGAMPLCDQPLSLVLPYARFAKACSEADLPPVG